jgi:hypothetical protein
MTLIAALDMKDLPCPVSEGIGRLGLRVLSVCTVFEVDGVGAAGVVAMDGRRIWVDTKGPLALDAQQRVPPWCWSQPSEHARSLSLTRAHP